MALQVPEDLTVGDPVLVTIQNSSRHDQTVHVAIANEEGDSVNLSVTLDGNGNGSANWTVANWNVVRFNYSTCEEVTRYPVPQPV